MSEQQSQKDEKWVGNIDPLGPQTEAKQAFVGFEEPPNINDLKTEKTSTSRRRRREAAPDSINKDENTSFGEGFIKRSNSILRDDTSNEVETNDDEEDELKDVSSSAKNNNFGDWETDDNILEIPDLEEEKQDVIDKIGRPPENFDRDLPSMEELDSNISISLSSTETGIDLGLLTRRLIPPEKIEEDHVKWDFDSLLLQLAQEFYANKEQKIKSDPGNPTSNEEKIGVKRTREVAR